MVKLSAKEQQVLYELIEHLTGTSQSGQYRKDILVANVETRMSKTGARSLGAYLAFIKDQREEYDRFLSSITIHTTSWFRELPHFHQIEKYIRSMIAKRGYSAEAPFKIWSVGCSTGQEVYSLALYLENLKKALPHFDFQISGTDIDPVSVERCRAAIYPSFELEQIPREYMPFVLVGTGSKEGLFTLDRSIRERCKFDLGSLNDNSMLSSRSGLDLVICRNVLIYFNTARCEEIIGFFQKALRPEGLLVIGHSEAGLVRDRELRSLGHSCFIKEKPAARRAFGPGHSGSKRILIVDDLPVARVSMKSLLQKNGYTVFEASSAEEASEMVKRERIDLVSLDLGLPGESGAAWLKRMRGEGLKTPIIIVSASDPTAVEAESLFGALEKGAQEFITKETVLHNFNRFIEVIEALTAEKDTELKVTPSMSAEERSKVISLQRKNLEKTLVPELILIGASTGGPDAIWKLLSRFPQPCPPVLIVQHTNPFFASHFALTVARNSGLTLGGNHEGEELLPNTFYMAHGDYHIEVQKKGNRLVLGYSNAEKRNGHRPSVDHLFNSVAALKVPSVAILLTGMGRDGAAGMMELFRAESCFNMAQNAESSVVFGMPKEAIELGAVDFTGNIQEIRSHLEGFVYQARKRSAS